MEGPYEVTFDDGSTEKVTAADPTAAKNIARNKRIQARDPGGNMNKADLMGHGSVKIRKVAELAVGLLVVLALHALDALLLAPAGLSLYADQGVLGAGVIDVLAFSGTAINTTIVALTAVSGDSAQVSSFSEAKKGWILQLWCDFQAAGTLRIHSPKMHENTNGIRFDIIASDLYPMLPWGAKQPIYPGDTINCDAAGSATGGDIEYVLLLRYFDELSAQQARLLTHEEVSRRLVNIHAVENTIATGATAAYAGSEAINAEIDQFKARTDYALMGYVVDTECPLVAWRGPDTASARVGGPGLETDRGETASWFMKLSRMCNMNLVPIIAADNKAATQIDALQDENGSDTTVISIYAELAKA